MENLSRVLVLCLFFAYPTEQKAWEEKHSPLRSEPKLSERFNWNRFDFNFENDAERQQALKNGSFNPNITIPYGMGIWEDKVFITIPRTEPGVPSTLSFFNLNSTENSPLLNPYPNWASNQLTPGNIISVYRVNVDSCDRLWAVDTGAEMDFAGNGQRIQPARLIIIDLKTDTMLRSHQISPTAGNVVYTNVFPDVRNSCDDAYAYAVDPSASGLLVYSFRRDESWRKTNPYFNPDPFQMDYRVNGLSFTWKDGIFGLALTEVGENGDRWAYFHPMSSLNEFKVDTKLLQESNSTLSTNQISVVATRYPTFQAASLVYDEKSGIMFYSLVNKNAIGCWNTKRKWGPNTGIVASNDRTMVYSTDLKIDKNSNLWALVNRAPEISYGGGLLSDQPNFRVYTGSIRQLIRNTNCEVHQHHRSFWSKDL